MLKARKIGELEDALAALPGLREKLRRFQATNLKQHAEEKTAVQAEARLLESVSGILSETKSLAEELRPSKETVEPVLPVEAEQKLPHRSTLEPLQKIAQEMNDALRQASDILVAAVKKGNEDLYSVRELWEPLRDAANKRFEDIKSKLSEEGHNPDEYVSLDDQVARLEPKQEEKKKLSDELSSLRRKRQGVIDEWEKADARAYSELERAAKKVSRELKGTVKAVIQPSSTIEPLREIFRRHVDGNISQALSKLEDLETLSLSKLAEKIREGVNPLMSEYGFTEASAKKISDGGEALALEVEECRIPPEALIELNVGREGSNNWKRLENLSAGQKATAVLLLLLLDAEAPLIIDQPEDDLDNQFIAGRVVPIMRSGKKRRSSSSQVITLIYRFGRCRSDHAFRQEASQFIFSSHNPNIPVWEMQIRS